MNSRLRYFLFIGVGVILLLSTIEIISRVVLGKIYNRSFDSSLIVDNKYLTSSGLKENASGMVWGKPFRTDEEGRRKNKTAFDAKKKKWLFIGDSVTEGVGVDDTSTFTSLCSEEFLEFNVLNYSLIGYSSSDYHTVLQSVLQSDTTVELVTLFFCLNDVYGSSKSKELPVMAKQNLRGKVNAFLQERSATYKLGKVFFYSNSGNYFKYDLQFYAADNPRFKESMSYLKQCDSVCKAKGIYFQVVMLPYKSQLTDTEKNRTPQQLVKQFCDKDSIGFSDAAGFLAKQPDHSSLYLFADEIHFSAKGHRAMAEFLSE